MTCPHCDSWLHNTTPVGWRDIVRHMDWYHDEMFDKWNRVEHYSTLIGSTVQGVTELTGKLLNFRREL